MIVHELSFYSQFKCSMGDCPNTCCHGWQIVFDDATCEKYKKEPGLTGFWLRHGITQRNGMTMFRRRRGFCPFLTKERTCGVQISLGEEYMPDVCRIFPRQRVNYGAFTEETLFLACPEAARLFLHNLNQLGFHTVERQTDYARLGTNEDTVFLQELLSIREAMTAQIAEPDTPRDRLYAGLLTYAGELQQYYIRKSAPHSAPCDFDCPSLPDLRATVGRAKPYFHITAGMMDQMLTGGFYHILLKTTSPFLYRLCRMYFKEFDHRTGAQAQERADELKAKLLDEVPGTEQLLRGHLIYYLLLEFLTTYENYSFLRVIATGIMHTQLLELMLALYYENTQSLAEEDLIQIIAVCDRRGRHCAEVEAGMYEVIAPSLLPPSGRR